MGTNSHSIRHEIRQNLALSVPLIAAQSIYAISSFVGTAMIARLGQDALAASILVSIVWVSLSMFFFGILNSVSVLVSHQYGAKDNVAISRIMGQSFWLGLMMTLLLFAILLIMPYGMQLSSQSSNVLTIANKYIYSLLWTVPGLVALIILEQFLAGINRPKLVLRISILVVPIEVPLIYMLIFGKFGLPACGVAGIGYGFAITYTMTTFVLVWYLMKSRQYRDFHIFSALYEKHTNYLKELLRVGLPMGFMHVIEVSAFAVATFWISQFGTTLLAAHQIVMQYLTFIISMVFAMSQAVTIRVGHGVGEKDIISVRYAYYVGAGMSAICMLLIMTGFVLLPDLFISLDINPHDPGNKLLIREAAALLSICGVLLIFDNLRIVGFGVLRGLKDTRFPMYSSLLSFWLIGLGLAYYFGFKHELAANGIWLGLTLGIASGSAIVFMRIHYILKRVNLSDVLKV